MTDEWVDGYRKAISRLLLERGHFVNLNAYPEEYDDSWWSPEPGDYNDGNVVYGWHDWDWKRHVEDGCRIVSWTYDSLREKSLSLFDNTFTDNKDEIGIEMKATCACGDYADRYVRWTGTLGEALQVILTEEETND